MGRQRSWLFDGTQGSADDGYHVVEGHTTKLNAGAQGKHIPGHNNYTPGRSIFLGSLADAQDLIDRFAGTGKWANDDMSKERVDLGKVIGIWVSRDGRNKLPTTRGIIHYSKKGAHIVPSYPSEEES